MLDDPEAMARAAATGMGIAMLPLPLPHALPLSLYYTSRELVPAKVRVFVDYILHEFHASGQAARFGQK